MKINIRFLFALFLLLGFSSHQIMAQTVLQKQSLDIFPKPEEGYKQLVIEVPHSDKDDLKKIELFVGKYMETDKCNHHSLSGNFEEIDLQGWGYSYYKFNTNGDIASTKMGCPDSEMITQFVKSQGKFVRYNGKLPIVIYVPDGYDVQFRIWKAEDETYRAAEVRNK